MKTVLVVMAASCVLLTCCLHTLLASRTEQFQSAGGSSGKKLILVHAQWCGHCKTLLAPDGSWSLMKERLPGVQIEEYDESSHPDLVRHLDVTGFPDIRLVDADMNTVAKYMGDRSSDSLVDFVLSNT